MASTDETKTDLFEFDEYGQEARYVSIVQARIAVIKHAQANHAGYGAGYTDMPLVWDLAETSSLDDDLYHILLHWKPAGDFQGTPGLEEFWVSKMGQLELRQVREWPKPEVTVKHGESADADKSEPNSNDMTKADWISQGDRFRSRSQYNLAVESYDEAVRLDPKYAVAYNNRGISYRELGDHRRAIEDYDQALRLDPKDAVAYKNRGISYTNLGNHRRAIEDYDEAVRLDPKDAVAYTNRGFAYSDLGEQRRALEDYDEAVRLDPKDAIAYNNRGNSYKELGNHPQADSDFKKAMELGLDA